MAGVDVSDLLTDPDFTSSVSLTRRAYAIEEATGKTTATPVTSTKMMVVQAPSAKDVENAPNGLRLHGAIVVYFAGELFAESPNGLPDIIASGGKTYEVKAIVEDYMNHGAGWTKALCTLVEVNNDAE